MRRARGQQAAALVLAGALVGSLSSCDGAPSGRGARAASPEAVASADSVVRAWVEEGRVPGAVLLASDRAGPLLATAHGWARAYDFGGGQYPSEGVPVAAAAIVPAAEPVPMSVETVFDLASVTKVMATTMAVALLADRGALEVDAPVRRYLPDFAGGGRDAITVEHLLTHRSGLPQWQPVYYHASEAAAAHAWVRDLALEWPVGAERHYSDLGFMVLGRLVERVSGLPLDRFLATELYGPLGLQATGFRGRAASAGGFGGRVLGFAATSHGNPFERRMVHDAGFGYRIAGDPDAWAGWRRYTLSGEVNDGNAHHAFGGVAGHAGLFSTASELEILLRLMLEGGELDGRRYLSGALVDRLLASTGDGQGLGWQIPADAPPSAFGHTGFTGTFVLGVRDTGLAVVLLTNRQHGGVDAETAYPDVGPLQRAVVAALPGRTGGR